MKQYIGLLWQEEGVRRHSSNNQPRALSLPVVTHKKTTPAAATAVPPHDAELCSR